MRKGMCFHAAAAIANEIERSHAVLIEGNRFPIDYAGEITARTAIVELRIIVRRGVRETSRGRSARLVRRGQPNLPPRSRMRSLMNGSLACAARSLASAALSRYLSARNDIRGEHWNRRAVPQVRRTRRPALVSRYRCLPDSVEL